MPMQTTKERFDAANKAVEWGKARRPDPTADFGATSPLPPRLRDWKVGRYSRIGDQPWAEFSTPDGIVKIYQGDMVPGTNYAFTLLGKEDDERGIEQLQAEFTSGVGERFLIPEGPSTEAAVEDTVSAFKRAIPSAEPADSPTITSSQLREEALSSGALSPDAPPESPLWRGSDLHSRFARKALKQYLNQPVEDNDISWDTRDTGQ